MTIWSAEIKELTALYESFKGKLPELEKELDRLVTTDDENMVLLYSRRCLEVIVTDLCEQELGRPRKTEPLKGVIDKLHKEEKVPSHIITSMQNLNSLATYGAHPIKFNPQQVRPVLIDLATVIGWYLEYKNIQIDIPRLQVQISDKTIEGNKDSTEEQIYDSKKSTSELHVEKTGILKEPAIDLKTQKKKKNIKRIIWTGSILINILFILLIINALKPAPISEKDWILITDFENQTGDDVFDQSLSTALEVSIQQSSFVNVLPRTRINETLKRMGKEQTEIIDEETGIEIAQREGIAVIVTCNISLIGDIYLLTARVVDVNTKKVLKTETFQADGKNEVLVSLDNLTRKIRRDLGESLKEINHDIVPLPEATTSSIDALKCLVKGNEAWSRDGQLAEAEDLFLKAIELDPEFAMAHAYLGSLYYWENNRTKGEEHFTRALNLSGRLTEKEKLWIQVRVEGFRGNYEKAAVQCNIFLRNYPSSSEGWYQLGYNYMRLGRYKEAIDAFNRSLEIHKDKDPGAYINIASCYSLQAKYQQSIEFYLEAFTLNPKLLVVPNLNHEFGFTYVEMGEYQKAQEVFEKMSELSDDRKARGIRSEALLLMYTGKFSEAITRLHESIVINKTNRNGVSELRDHMFLATIYKTKGMIPEFHSELNKVRELLKIEGMEPWWFFLYGKIMIRDGKIQSAEKILNEISGRINEGNKADQSAFNALKGEIELAKANYAEALDLIESAVKLRGDGYILESLANYYYKTGDLDKAIPKYEEIISLKNSLGWEAQEYWIQAHYNLGKIFEEQGNREQAIKYFQDFINIWKDADKDIPSLMDAKSRLAKLHE
jgi:tetratricopeptide (TPR) repeat protein